VNSPKDPSSTPLPTAVVLLSGGMDSCVATAVASCDHNLALLHLTYGQRTLNRERRAFDDIANHYRVPQHRRRAVDIDFLAQIGCSALTDPDIPIPKAVDEPTRIPATYVPFRNAHLLALGVSWAEAIHAESVFIGVIEEDSAGYPDCTQAFTTAFAEAVRVGTATPPRIVTPLINGSKADVVRLGAELDAPLHMTWSCYQDEDRPCGNCDSCARRKRAFAEAAIPDPIISGTA
jgi:7-cyano-7-deazaguanine synthase